MFFPIRGSGSERLQRRSAAMRRVGSDMGGLNRGLASREIWKMRPAADFTRRVTFATHSIPSNTFRPGIKLLKMRRKVTEN